MILTSKDPAGRGVRPISISKIEVYVEQDRAEAIAAAILDSAHAGATGGGIVAILPVENVFSIRTRSEEIPNRIRR